MKRTTCLVCGSDILCDLYPIGDLPLSCLDTYLKPTESEAKDVTKFPMEFVQCQVCSHIFNTIYDPHVIQYDSGATIMYNTTSEWAKHLNNVLHYLGGFLEANSTVVEIGSGDGSFLRELQLRYQVDMVGFDPGTTRPKNVIQDYFVPQRDLKKYHPNLIVCRHTLEHMEDPRSTLSDLSYWCREYDMSPWVFMEVPNFESAFEQGRVQDLTYAHVSQFSEESFSTLLGLSGFETYMGLSTFNDEILVGMFCPNLPTRPLREYNRIVKNSLQSLIAIEDIVVWGGSGKCASFLNIYHEANITHVVDSDTKKIGRYVPGTGQLITDPSTIQPHESILIPNAWRAGDIYHEIQSRGLQYKQILIPSEGELNEYRPETTSR